MSSRHHCLSSGCIISAAMDLTCTSFSVPWCRYTGAYRDWAYFEQGSMFCLFELGACRQALRFLYFKTWLRLWIMNRSLQQVSPRTKHERLGGKADKLPTWSPANHQSRCASECRPATNLISQWCDSQKNPICSLWHLDRHITSPSWIFATWS